MGWAMRESDENFAGRARTLNRRSLLKSGAACAAGLLLGGGPACARLLAPPKTLAFYNLHTGERVKTEFSAGGDFIPEALTRINRVLRDHRTNEIHPIDTDLLELLFALQRQTGARGEFHVISGYRSPASNAKLQAAGGGVATRSLHMSGKAIDIALPGCSLADLRRAALRLRGGGVGYYPSSGFVHVDTGRVRQWA